MAARRPPSAPSRCGCQSRVDGLFWPRGPSESEKAARAAARHGAAAWRGIAWRRTACGVAPTTRSSAGCWWSGWWWWAPPCWRSRRRAGRRPGRPGASWAAASRRGGATGAGWFLSSIARSGRLRGQGGGCPTLAARAEENGDAGAAAVDEAVAGVEEVQKRISVIASRADALGTRSKEIYLVLDLITEIAQETHILSLNAAIEAAAAGADGRRFSVVAEAVRHLAQRSQESVESVRNLLDEFAGSIRATIVATEEGSTEARRVFERPRAAAAAISELRHASGDTSRVARQISLATQQQNAASDEVVMTLREASLVVQRMTGGLKDLPATADRLNALA